ncbi:MAG: hypothetical protein IKQ17_13455 [Kiritimatiellae bacterium]|nr:hypothetical protein [Kiritimatiellia bacterium]
MKTLVLIPMTFLATFAVADTARFSALVVDATTRQPLHGATVKAWFENKIGWRAWNESTPYITETKISDEVGICKMVNKTNTGKVSCWVETAPKGYYKSLGESWKFTATSIFGTWQPDNVVVTVALDRVEKPVPLHVRNLSFPPGKLVEEMSDVEKGPVSYDFLKGDWLPPWGNGEVADVMFFRKPREDCGVGVNFCGEKDQSFKDVVTIDFLGEGNGLVEVAANVASELKVRTAPEQGFSPHYEQSCGVGKDLKVFRSRNESKCLCFRVRTKYDEKGNVVEGYYGKIYGDVVMEWSYLGVSRVGFLYYLNPTPNDRNLEWDRKNNLCPNPGNIGTPRP